MIDEYGYRIIEFQNFLSTGGHFVIRTKPSSTLSPISQPELTPILQSSLEKHPKPAQDCSMSPSHKLMHTNHRSMGCDDVQPLTQPAMNVRKQPS